MRARERYVLWGVLSPRRRRGHEVARVGSRASSLFFTVLLLAAVSTVLDVPIMSGGLVAISRRWWNETGGYDSSMLGWGGENIDLSLRIWRCGGAIKAAKESYVAHMYREPGKPKTAARFRVPKGAPTRNRATSARAHFGRLWAKTAAFPLFEAHRLAPPDTSNIERWAGYGTRP